MEQQKKESKADKIRALTAQGMKPRDIAATVGSTLQSVYDVQYKERMRAKKKELASSVRISPVTGKPVRKYTKRKAKKSLAERGAELRRMTQERRADRNVQVSKFTLLELDRNRLKDEVFDLQELNSQLVREIEHLKNRSPLTIELPVPQPFSHYTFMQRLGILFLGRTPA